MANLTVAGKHSAVQAELCIAALNEVQVLYTMFILILNVLLSLHPPSKLLLRCLATTDLLVGLVSQPLYIIYLLSLITTREHGGNDLCVYSATLSTVSSSILCLVSLMTSTAISVDRLLALQIQTSCNVQAHVSCDNRFLVAGHCVCVSLVANIHIRQEKGLCSSDSMSWKFGDLRFLLHKDYYEIKSSSKSSTNASQ